MKNYVDGRSDLSRYPKKIARVRALKRQRDKKIDETVDLLEKGGTRDEAILMLVEKFNISKWTAILYINLAYKKVASRYESTYDDVVGVHCQRYERIYSKSILAIKELQSSDQEQFIKKAPALYADALMAMKRKEILMGAHDNCVKSEHISDISDMFEREKTIYKFDNFSLEDLIEYRDLINNARKNEIDGIHPLIIKQNNENNKSIIDKSDKNVDINKNNNFLALESVVEDIKAEVIEEVQDEDNKSYNDFISKINKSDEELFLKMIASNKND